MSSIWPWGKTHHDEKVFEPADQGNVGQVRTWNCMVSMGGS